ncbi:hypothetical protein [Iningainema tapete]|uniref:Uncharacterized protein n=1 Tax=Iningainema tapete BLCC-T55 TaxID=2748662 RepID=A0A8J7BXQ1_9CYAN|nr:hypothetical protein [Iningainema tapete]MBD2773328.1 hypothetical protein [Iningainema tapete BLCC-T55]
MSKPIGYFCNYTPGDGGLLGDIEAECGSTFENLNQSQKLWILAYCAGAMTATETENYDPNEVGDDITPLCERLHELTLFDQLGLIKCLTENI